MAEKTKTQVLIVEDNSFYQRILSNVLEEFALSYAKSASEALKMARAMKPEIIFLDVGLPDAKGNEIIKKLLAIVPTAFIVMVTGDNTIETIESSLKAGAKGYIVKPYSRSKIDDSLNKWRATKE